MIVFEKIRYKNFLSTGAQFTEIELNKHGTTLIVGINGAGKSTILDALSFSLFGKAFRKINKPQLINSINNKNMVVEVEFVIGKSKYKIIRGMKPAIFEVYMNGTLLNQSAESKDYQEILESQILKVNHRSFCQVVMLGSATYQPFMSLPTPQRREIIEDLLDLNIFTSMNKILKTRQEENKDVLKDLSYQKKLNEEKIKILKEHLEELQRNNTQAIEDKKERIKQFNNEIIELRKEGAEVQEELSLLSEGIDDEEIVRAKQQKLSKLRAKIEANMHSLMEENNFYHDNNTCPTCQQNIDPDFKSNKVSDNTADIEDYIVGLEKLTIQQDDLDKYIQDIQTRNKSITKLAIEKQKIIGRARSLQEQIKHLEEEIEEMSKVHDTNDSEKITELEADLVTIETKYHELVEEKDVLTTAGTLLKDDGIKAKIIKQYVPVINKLINKYLASIEFVCKFELDENFNETIKSRGRDEFTYGSFSEGEKVRINLAILFTWRAIAKLRNSISTNLLIMDEVFDGSMDGFGTDEFIKLIQTLTKDTNIFIISHKQVMFDKFDKVIAFEKKKNFSKVVSI